MKLGDCCVDCVSCHLVVTALPLHRSVFRRLVQRYSLQPNPDRRKLTPCPGNLRLPLSPRNTAQRSAVKKIFINLLSEFKSKQNIMQKTILFMPFKMISSYV